MTKERFFEEMEIIQEVKNINSDNVDNYRELINSFYMCDNYDFWQWLEAVTEYTKNDVHRHIAIYGQNDTEIAIKAIKGNLEVPHLTSEQMTNLERHLEKMKTEVCEMTEEEWSLTRLASIEKGFTKDKWYLTFVFNEKNILNCRHCPHKNDTSRGCGQQNCWVKVSCRG